MNSKCLRLVRICLALFVEKSRVISYKRGLLFCYRCVGFFLRTSNVIIDNKARVFLCLFINYRALFLS